MREKKKGKREKDISGKCAGGYKDLTREVSANMFCSGIFCMLLFDVITGFIRKV